MSSKYQDRYIFIIYKKDLTKATTMNKKTKYIIGSLIKKTNM